MSSSVDSLRAAGPPDPSDDGTATDRFRAPTGDDDTERFRSPTAPAEAGSGEPAGSDDEDPSSVGAEPVPDDESGDEPAGGSTAASRSRRRSRGLRVPAAPARPVAAPSRPATSVPSAAAPPSAPIAVALGATAPPLGARSAAGGPPPPLPVGGPPPPSSSPTPPPRTAALGRLVLVLVLVAAVVGTVVVLQQRSQFGRDTAGSEEIPALEVAPAQVDLGTVGQPTALAPPSALLPGTSASRPGQGAPTVSAWANGLAPKTNIPAVALQAYGLADMTMRQADPQCHLSWVTIAGLARIESNHGRYRGAHIEPNGDIEPRIVGVPLDGTSGNRTISDTDGGLLDGDPTLDRAVGPLQFIPSTWAKWRADGNDDGRADPDNIFDAALAAGRYLCAGGRDLASGEGWRSAVLSYNNSDDYGRRVYAAAQAYANSTTP